MIKFLENNNKKEKIRYKIVFKMFKFEIMEYNKEFTIYQLIIILNNKILLNNQLLMKIL